MSAVLVKTIRGQSSAPDLRGEQPAARSGGQPSMEMRQFFDTFMKGSRLLLLAISALVTVVAAVGILVSIYNSGLRPPARNRHPPRAGRHAFGAYWR